MDTSFWIVLTIALTVGWVITTWIRAKHGYPVEDTLGFSVHPVKHTDEQALQKRLNDELAARDRTIADLKERVEVLERIVTDKSTRLSESIDRLNS